MKRAQPEAVLSAREVEVLSLIVEGLTNKEIARRITASPATVKRHVENILFKLKLKNRVEAAVYAVSNDGR